MDEQTANAEKDFKEESIPVTKLVQSSDLNSPSIEPWKLSSFELDDKIESTKMSEEVYEKLHKEIEPEVQKQAELIKKEAYDSAFEQGYQEGLQKGLDDGLKQGESEARAKVMETIEPKIEQFDSILSALHKPFDTLENQIYLELVDFALHVAQTVIKKNVIDDKNWVLKAVQESVEQLTESSSIINVYLHPDDLAFLQISKPSISEKWQLHESHSVEQGTCLVKQDYSTILNSWIARFDDIVEQTSQNSIDESDKPGQLDGSKS